MRLRDLGEFLAEDEPLVLPIRGTDYTFAGTVSAASWLTLQAVGARLGGDPGQTVLTTAEELALMDDLLGPAKDEMVANGVTSAEIEHVFATVFMYHLRGGGAAGRTAAELVWNSAGEPAAPNRDPVPARGYPGGSTQQNSNEAPGCPPATS